jgi:hypothetical protein
MKRGRFSGASHGAAKIPTSPMSTDVEELARALDADQLLELADELERRVARMRQAAALMPAAKAGAGAWKALSALERSEYKLHPANRN